MSVEDLRLGQAARALRRKQGVLQRELVVVGRSIDFTRRLESGRAGGLRLDDLRHHFAELGATPRVTAWWNGAALDRLLDERHAQVVDGGVFVLKRLGWDQVETEVTFNEWGERGLMDLFAARPDLGGIFVGEAKSEWGSIEETIRRLDVKLRLAPKISETRFGFRPKTVGAALIFAEDRTARRIAAKFSATLAAAYPDRNRSVQRWLRNPSGRLRGLWFLTDVDTNRPARR